MNKEELKEFLLWVLAFIIALLPYIIIMFRGSQRDLINDILIWSIFPWLIFLGQILKILVKALKEMEEETKC